MTATAHDPQLAARDAFLVALGEADLLTQSQLTRVAEVAAEAKPTAKDTARSLVSAGLLTKFQAERLLAGRTDGFHLGPYVILDQIGRGRVGRLYKARHRTMNRLVAVKVMASEYTRTPADRQALQDGVRAAAQLDHPHIVTAYDANEFGGRFYIVLEFVDGPNFETVVQERGPLSIAEVCELGRQIAMGLDHAHSRGMVHQDIKPTKLLIARPSKMTAEPVVKIADFGITQVVRSLANATLPNSSGSRADYTAPELAEHATAADPRSDLYSLGCVLYFLLTGQPPFAGGTVNDKLRRHQLESPARIELLRPDVPPALAALVYHLLAKQPAQRPESAAVVAEQLAHMLVQMGGFVSFELPVTQPVPSSGTHPIPQPDTQPLTLDDAEVSTEDTAPWGDFTLSNDEPDATQEWTPRYRPKRANSQNGLLLVVLGVLITAGVAASIAFLK